jgi:hypothetical protein
MTFGQKTTFTTGIRPAVIKVALGRSNPVAPREPGSLSPIVKTRKFLLRQRNVATSFPPFSHTSYTYKCFKIFQKKNFLYIFFLAFFSDISRAFADISLARVKFIQRFIGPSPGRAIKPIRKKGKRKVKERKERIRYRTDEKSEIERG